METRRCKGCNQERPLAQFNKGGQGGYRSQCNSCRSRQARRKAEQRKALGPPETRTCVWCGNKFLAASRPAGDPYCSDGCHQVRERIYRKFPETQRLSGAQIDNATIAFAQAFWGDARERLAAGDERVLWWLTLHSGDHFVWWAEYFGVEQPDALAADLLALWNPLRPPVSGRPRVNDNSPDGRTTPLCAKCGTADPSAFARKGAGYHYYCRACYREMMRNYRARLKALREGEAA